MRSGFQWFALYAGMESVDFTFPLGFNSQSDFTTTTMVRSLIGIFQNGHGSSVSAPVD